jgi:hypothetical protein
MGPIDLTGEADRTLLSDGVLVRLNALLAELDPAEEIEFRCALVDRYRRVLERTGSIVAAEHLVRWVRSASAGSRSRTLHILAPHLPSWLRGPLRSVFLPLAVDWARWAIRTERWAELRDLIEAMNAGKDEWVRKHLVKLEYDGYFELLAASFESHPSQEPLAGALVALGLPIVPYMAVRIPHISNPLVIEHFMVVMTTISPTAWRTLLSLISPQSSPVEAINVLNALELAARGEEEYGKFLSTLVDRRDILSHSDLLRFAQSAETNGARDIILQLLKTESEFVRQMAVQQAEVMSISGLGRYVVPLLVPSSAPGLLLAICRYLRAFPYPRALDALIRLYECKPGYLRFGRAVSAEVRAAVVLAVAAVRCARSRDLVAEARGSSEPEIRAAARSCVII